MSDDFQEDPFPRTPVADGDGSDIDWPMAQLHVDQALVGFRTPKDSKVRDNIAANLQAALNALNPP